jgi:5-carboxymethyl-2-hydroxymuconate isomerase|tara:strand:+ start:431 stop:754 length:324 start_codon:yes stop_codon:yes gene_type:complete
MPHIVLEHGGLDQPLPPLMQALAEAVAAHPAVPRDAVKVRAHRVDYLLLSGEPSFAHVTLRLMDTRGADQHSELADAVMQVLRRDLPETCALCVETVAIPKASFRKR